MAPVLRKALKDTPVVVLTGMRQTGKSTMLLRQPELRKRRYVTLDDFETLEEARRNPEALADSREDITIDEVQRCPELLIAIKRAVDRKRVPGRFLLSGSANFSLLKGVSESLAGRSLYLRMHPLNMRERRDKSGGLPFLAAMFREGRPPSKSGVEPVPLQDVLVGGMPAVALKIARDPASWFRGYEQTYLERDVRSLSQVADLSSFRLLLRLASLRSGKILQVSELARDAKLPASTADRYLGLMETSFVASRIGPFLSNKSSRLIKSPKLFIGDSGLAAYLAGFGKAGPGGDESFRGALYETWAAQNLSAILEAHMPEARMHFWSVQGRYEVDFIVEEGADTMAIEIKAGNRWRDRDLSGLKAFLSSTPGCRAGILVHNGREVSHLGDKLWAIPLALFFS